MTTTPRPLTIGLGLLVVGVLTATACSPAPDASETSADGDLTEVRVGPLSTQNLLTLSEESGGLEDSVGDDATVDVAAPFTAFAPGAQALAAGQIDITSGSVTSLVGAVDATPELVAFAVEVNNNDTQGIVAAPDSDIDAVEDLVGQRVAVNQGGTGEYILLSALDDAGIDPSEVDRVYLDPEDSASAFSTGQVDAWATWDAYLASAVSTDGAELVAVANEIGAVNPTIHVTTREFAENHPEELRAVYDALVAEGERVNDDPDVIPEAYTAAGLPEDAVEVIRGFAPPTIAPADADFVADLQRAADVYADHGLIDTELNVEDNAVDVSQS
ncbi:ABC transporter substrate-binding protein [Spiractinospora alimapuensis]|uniref:ABC transporter substrate-binding protein n=1 Tax=Spiractinospora alimapuensis TaxID=2820884 RepID=UPI001F158CAF|nr:ABC transporter substrate-binding protein [Spiractinospora alimapuensis]QVQ52758.1 ABC transporter substrate-binding protein [Spiractinospora alimapuensis]